MKSSNKSILNSILNDWANQFPELVKYKSGQKLYKRVGPVVIGIELEKFLSDEYRPRFIMINLLDSSNNTIVYCISQTIRDSKGLDVTIPYSHHEQKYLNACQLMREQAKVSFNRNISIEDIIIGILSYIEKDLLGNPYWSCLAVMQLSRLLSDEILKAAYFNRAFSILTKEVPTQLLELQTKGLTKWVEDIRSLTHEEIDRAIEESLNKYKLKEIT